MKLLALYSTLIILPASLGLSQDMPPARQAAIDAAGKLEAQVRHLSLELWKYSETALHEHKSVALLSDVLEQEGFKVQRNVGGMPTAFIATYGTGRPIIGILAEYDALPGVGNEAVPRREPRKDGITSGQGCGHNVFGAASVCGAIAVKRTMEALGITGTTRLYGCPAEETLVGKVYMARAGVFDDLDAAIDWHPSDENGVKNNPGLAMNNFQIEFFGQSAHGAVNPWDGRSALDAVELMNYGVNLMREHVEPTTRIHYVIPAAGDAPNVVPNYAKVWYYARDVNRESVDRLYERILKVAKGAAIATETTHKVTLLTGCHEYLLLRSLQERLQEHLETVGPPQFTDEEQQFGCTLQRSLGIAEEGFDDTITPLDPEPEAPFGGSTDVAEVSWITPTVGFRMATTAQSVPWHSWAVTACQASDGGIRGAVVATKLIAVTGVDLLTDAELLKKAKQEFIEKTGGQPYKSPVPDDQPVPLPGTEQ